VTFQTKACEPRALPAVLTFAAASSRTSVCGGAQAACAAGAAAAAAPSVASASAHGMWKRAGTAVQSLRRGRRVVALKRGGDAEGCVAGPA
jgi:hypothetical protein